MCRIAGFWDRSNNNYDRWSVLRSMRDSLEHGGPDDAGEYMDDASGIAFGHRRLSIIDLSELGNQPMHFEHLSIVFNGEVYNYKEIQQQLRQEGYSFVSDSDTEVVLKAFHRWGTKCVEQFHGMWAFAIADKSTGKLLLCRDRIGVKPLFYYHKEGLFAFASELKGLLPHPGFNKELDLAAAKQFVRFGFIAAPHTIYRHTRKLLPGHWLTVDSNQQIEEYPYWELKSSQPEELSDAEWVKRTKEELLKAARLRMVADVPVGVFLSGGVDSSLVASLLQESVSSKLQTFTIGFEDQQFDESSVARKIAEHLGTQHHEWMCSDKEALDLVHDLPKVYDEPFGDSSAIPTLLLARKSREHVKVALSADGGDELFAGYDAFYEVLKLRDESQPAVRSSLRYQLTNALDRKKAFILDPAMYAKRVRQSFRKSNSDITELLQFQMSLAHPEMIDWLFREPSIMCESRSSEMNTHDLDRMAHWDVLNYLPDDIMQKVDRATMSVALEGREPLLDHRLVEFAFGLPLDMKFRDGTRKYALRKILAEYLPSEIINLPKRGFSPPLKSWFASALRDSVQESFDPARIRQQGIFEPRMMQAIQHHALHTGLVHPKFLWNLFVFQLWYDEYFG